MEAVARIHLHTSENCATAVEVVRCLREAGHSAFLVGGCVRDLVLGLEPKDYDVATSAPPDAVMRLFRHVIAVGAAFGVVRVRQRGRDTGTWHEIEVATFRADVSYSDGRRPDAVRFTDAREDVLRRDFTLNGLLLDPLPDQEVVAGHGAPSAGGCLVVDWVGGLEDLAHGVLRAIGEPERRFAEDALRMLRAPRFAARFGLKMDPATAEAIRTANRTLRRVSTERVTAELAAMLTVPTAPRALHLLADLRLAEVLWPDLAGLDPDLREMASRFERLRTCLALEPPGEGHLPLVAEVDLPLAVATLAWPVRHLPGLGGVEHTFRLSKAEGVALQRIHQLAEDLQRDAGPIDPARPFLARLLREHLADAALVLLLADGQGDVQRLEALRSLRRQTPASRWHPVQAVTGDDLKALGYLPGPAFRTALRAAEDAQLAGGDVEAARSAALATLRDERPMLS